MNPVNRLRYWFRKRFPKDRKFANYIYSLTGVKPSDLDLFRLALRHQSKYPGSNNNNERLELLGDAVIDFLVLDYLYHKFPFRDEGFISNLKSKIVNRTQLNQVGKKMGLLEHLEYNRRSFQTGPTDLAGNTFEALVGAIYLDAGSDAARRFVQQRMLRHLLDVNNIQQEDTDYKSRIYHFAQKNGKSLSFRTIREVQKQGRSYFTIQLSLNGEPVSEGEGFNKKTAEQQAARKAVEQLNIPSSQGS